MNSYEFWKYDLTPQGKAWTTTDTAGTVSATSYPGVLVVNASTATAATGATTTINTPVGFEIIGVKAINATSEAATVTISNNTDAISVIVTNATTADLPKDGAVDATYGEFTSGDNDLVIDIGAASHVSVFTLVFELVYK